MMPELARASQVLRPRKLNPVSDLFIIGMDYSELGPVLHISATIVLAIDDVLFA